MAMTGGKSQQIARWFIVAAFALGALLRLLNLSNVHARTPDEHTYTVQAAALLHEGIPGLRRVVAEYVNDDTKRFFPPPSRIGYTGPIAGLMAATGRSDHLMGAWVSCLASIAGLALTALIGVKVFAPWVGAIATFLLATFPPDLVIARRAWSDAWVSVLTYALLYCALSLARRPTSLPLAVTFVAASSIFVMTKEISAIVCGFCVLWIVAYQRRSSIPVVTATAIAATVSLAFVSWAIGGTATLWNIQSRIGAFHLANTYALDYQSGPAYWLLKSFWIVSPWTLMMALTGLMTTPFFDVWRDRRGAVALSTFVVVILALPLALPGWLNLRYSSLVFGPLCILAASAMYLGFSMLHTRLPVATVTAIAILGCAGIAAAGLRDYRYFNRWFVSTQTPDLSVRMLFATSGEDRLLRPLRASPPAATGPGTPSARAVSALKQSLTFYRQGRFDDAITAARDAVALRPDFAQAHNYLAAAYASKGMWDEAIRAAEEAIRLKPDFQSAKNNLAWARVEKAKSGSRR